MLWISTHTCSFQRIVGNLTVSLLVCMNTGQTISPKTSNRIRLCKHWSDAARPPTFTLKPFFKQTLVWLLVWILSNNKSARVSCWRQRSWAAAVFFRGLGFPLQPKTIPASYKHTVVCGVNPHLLLLVWLRYSLAYLIDCDTKINVRESCCFWIEKEKVRPPFIACVCVCVLTNVLIMQIIIRHWQCSMLYSR